MNTEHTITHTPTDYYKLLKQFTKAKFTHSIDRIDRLYWFCFGPCSDFTFTSYHSSHQLLNSIFTHTCLFSEYSRSNFLLITSEILMIDTHMYILIMVILNPLNLDSVFQMKLLAFYASVQHNNSTTNIHAINYYHLCFDKSKSSIECTIGIDAHCVSHRHQIHVSFRSEAEL